ncbi:hypothetical protein [Archangium primigenium]|uniref:hypothetical protein n=1 Tax=[Archangium] primigenium TaxID=2792470 RepID=UPI001959C34C|nr:hypothetical protein [Archangium primigenium]MBM7119096.1 hypothetical protein [Archangium primigenium]
MEDETKGQGDRVGEYLLGRECEEVGPELGRLHEARNERNGNSALVLRPETRVDWDLEEGWQVRISSERSRGFVRIEVERSPPSGRLTKLVDLIALVFAALTRVEDNARVGAHMTRGRLRSALSVVWGRAGLVGLLLCVGSLLSCLSVTSRVAEEPRSGLGMVSAGPTDAAQTINAAETGPLPIAYPMPEKPFRNQAKPPCDVDRDEVEINGGCWMALDRKPPCLVKSQAVHQGKCYLPVGKRTSPLQSLEP